MNFSEALTELKSGKKISRAGWNGKNMWLVLQKGYPEGIPINKNTAEATGIPEGYVCQFLPYIMMNCNTLEKIMQDGETYQPVPVFVPWLASQTDILAEDWGTV